MAVNTYQLITDEIIKKLEQGKIPWKRSFNGVELPPRNFKSKKMYKGINLLMLGMSGYKSPYWLTFNQAKDMGGQVTKGSKATRILFAKMMNYKDKDDKDQMRPIYKYSSVFNLDVIDGIDCPVSNLEPEQQREVQYIENCEAVLSVMKEKNKIPPIKYHDLFRAYYSPGEDIIRTCEIQDYISDEEYYSTLFHEIIHSTGHNSRLKRDMTGGKQSKAYAKEELIAEIGSCFICGMTGIKTAIIDNATAYIQSWLGALKDDPTLIVQAASRAQKAVEYLNIQDADVETQEEADE